MADRDRYDDLAKALVRRFGCAIMRGCESDIQDAVASALRSAVAEEREAADLYRAFYDAWVESEVAGATGDPDFAQQKRKALVKLHQVIRSRGEKADG